jgi:penicillin amidase
MLPSIVFQQHIRCPGLDAIGAAIPGSPYVVIGHTESVAWTITAAMGDVIDLYIERPDAGDASRIIGPDGTQPLVVEDMVVRARDGTSFTETVAQLRSTPRGPLLNDMYPDLLPAGAPLVSVHGIPSSVAGSLRGFRRANRAADVDELRDAMTGISSPLCAVCAADTTGRIALFATGSVPIRRSHRGTFPVPAWVPEYRWQDWGGPADMPHATGTGEDLFANTNNLLVDPRRSPVPFHVDSAPSYRRDRIVEMLEAVAQHDRDSMSVIQGDVLLLRARRLLPTILRDMAGARDLTDLEEKALAILHTWDCRAKADSAACTIFFSVYRQVIIAALEDEVRGRPFDFLLGFRYFTNGVDEWFENPTHPVWDDRSTGELETRSDTVRRAFRRGVGWLEERLGGADPGAWAWGKLHVLQPAHPFGAELSSFNLDAWAAPGASASVWKTYFDMSSAEDPFRYQYGPVLRVVIDLADLEHGWWVIDTGSSGWPLSPHYGDQHGLWKSRDLAPMVSDWEELKASAVGVLTLQ